MLRERDISGFSEFYFYIREASLCCLNVVRKPLPRSLLRSFNLSNLKLVSVQVLPVLTMQFLLFYICVCKALSRSLVCPFKAVKFLTFLMLNAEFTIGLFQTVYSLLSVPQKISLALFKGSALAINPDGVLKSYELALFCL